MPPGRMYQMAAVPCSRRVGLSSGEPDVMFVGDAAGLVDPLLGEGIYNAVRSGTIAAQAIRDAIRQGRNTYGRRLREITRDQSSSMFVSRMFYRHLDHGYRLLTSPPVRYVLMKGMVLGLNLRQTKMLCPLLPLMQPPRSVQ